MCFRCTFFVVTAVVVVVVVVVVALVVVVRINFSLKGQLGVPLTVYPWYLLCSLWGL